MVTPAQVYGRMFGALQSLSAALAPFVIAIVGFVLEGAGAGAAVSILYRA